MMDHPMGWSIGREHDASECLTRPVDPSRKEAAMPKPKRSKAVSVGRKTVKA